MRLLRELVAARVPLAAGELARRAELNRTSVYPALEVLASAGIVSFVGAGVQRQVRLRRAHPLAAAVISLFRAESKRKQDLVVQLQEAAKALKPQPTAAWIEPPASAETADPVVCYLLADPTTLSELTDRLVERIGDIERKYDVTIEVRPITRSELAARPDATKLDDAILLAGVPPKALRVDPARPRDRRLRSHANHDASARRLGVAIAEKLRQDPGIILRARAQLARRGASASAHEQRELGEWSRILRSMPPARLRRFLMQDSERATRLRRTLPLLDVLSAAERQAVLASTTDAETRAAVIRKGGRARK